MPYDPARHGPRRLVGPGFHGGVHAVVRRIPVGRVATYGDVGEALGSRRIARQVGFALAALPEGSDVPWWRVVSAGGVLARRGTAAGKAQAAALRREGLQIRGGRVVDFDRYRWSATGISAVSRSN
jgi:methylated-DNA-protein-cysteine methyltransferase-like protein